MLRRVSSAVVRRDALFDHEAADDKDDSQARARSD